MNDDYFALLGEPRRPWLDAGALKTRFHARVAREHPDVADTAGKGGDAGAFSRLNVAYGVLNDPRARLRHLLELEQGEASPRHQPVPERIGAIFTRMGGRKQAIDRFLKKRAGAGSALARAMLADEQYQLAEQAEAWLAELEAERGWWLARLPEIDALWNREGSDRAALLPELAAIAQALGYLDKWCAQMREGVVRLHLEE